VYIDSRKRGSVTPPKLATILVVGMGIMGLLASPYMLSAQEAFAHGKNHDKKNNGEGNEIPPGYIVVDGELSELQFESGPNPANNPGEGPIADYDIDPQGTISFGEHFSFLVPQAPGVLKNAESAELLICYDEDCANDDFRISTELVDVNDEEFLFVQTHVIDAPILGEDLFTANEVGFDIVMWWTVEFTDGTDQTYAAVVHLEGDPCEEHGWIDFGGDKCAAPEG
jgi:hypothetical protein